MSNQHDPGRLSVEKQRFAMVPEWVIDADIGDAAFRLYAVLLRYGQSSGQRMPSRATLARRLRKRSVDTVDRAMKELVALGAVVVERRRDGSQNLTNLYHVRTSSPDRSVAATAEPDAAGRAAAASLRDTDAARCGRKHAVAVAATVRPNPDPSTESSPPPSPPELARQCRELRRQLGLPGTRWSAAAVEAACVRAGERGWPTDRVTQSLLVVAADPCSMSPMRVAEAGPWWEVRSEQAPAADTDELERELDLLDGRRAFLQRQAREQLERQGVPLTRSTVVRRAVELARQGA